MKKIVKKKKKVVKARFNQRGSSKIGIIIAAIVIVVGLGGFYVMSQKTNISLPGLKPALNPNCEFKDPDLCKFMNNWVNQKEYSVTTTSTQEGTKVESQMDISGTDKSHMLSKQNGKEIYNMITIGDTTYTLDYSDNKWWKMTLTPDKQKDSPVQQAKDEVAFDTKNTPQDKTTYKFITKEACGDKTCFKYQIVDPSSTETTQFIWFDDQDYLLRKISIEDKTSGVTEMVYSYGNVNISVPSPVKDGTPDAAGNSPQTQQMMQQYQQQAQDQQQAPADNSGDQSAPADNAPSGY